jgi:hypothetical protein
VDIGILSSPVPGGPRSLSRNGMGELELAYYLCRAPVGTTDEDLPDPVAGSRRAIEECFQTASTESGLENYQVRRYDAYGTPRWPC